MNEILGELQQKMLSVAWDGGLEGDWDFVLDKSCLGQKTSGTSHNVPCVIPFLFKSSRKKYRYEQKFRQL